MSNVEVVRTHSRDRFEKSFLVGLRDREKRRKLKRVLFLLSVSYTPDILALHVWTLDFPFISQHSKESVSDEYGQTQTPDQGDGIEEIRISGAGVYPQVVECWTEEGGI